MSTPTIANIPTAYKAGKIYSQLPVDGSADFDVTRNSTATRVNQNGLIEEVGIDVPRLDYTDGGCPVWLREAQSTNLITYSEDFTDASWSKFDVTITSSSVLAPDGSSTATTIESTGSNDAMQFIASGTASVDYTGSFCLKSTNGSSITVGIRVGDAGNVLTVTLTDKWQRFSYTDQGSTTTIRCAIVLQNSLGKQVDVFGAQLEEQSHATSYIPTSGSTVTRAEDQFSLDTSSLGLSEITETFFDNSTNVITPVPSSYVVSEGKIKQIEGV